MRSESEGWGMWCQAASSMACWYSCSLVRATGPSGQTPRDNGMFTSDSCRGGWDEVGGADVLLRMMSRSVRCNVGTGSSIPELMAARSAMDFRELRGSGALISGVVLNCGGPLSRVPAALASLKLGVGELGGFTGSGTRRLGPPELFPEPEATLPVPDGAAELDSFEVLGAGL